VPRRRTLAAATGRVVDDCDGDALLHSAYIMLAVLLSNMLAQPSDTVHCLSSAPCHNETAWMHKVLTGILPDDLSLMAHDAHDNNLHSIYLKFIKS